LHYDEETGLHYNYFRDYKPMIGRYLTFDPALTKSGNPGIPSLVLRVLDDPLKLNPYLYAESNPITLVDKLGLESATSGEKDPCKCASFWTREPCKFNYNLDFIDCAFQYPYDPERRKKCEDGARKRLKKCCETGVYPWKY
jgi:RHS repeat-associated protein